MSDNNPWQDDALVLAEMRALVATLRQAHARHLAEIREVEHLDREDDPSFRPLRAWWVRPEGDAGEMGNGYYTMAERLARVADYIEWLIATEEWEGSDREGEPPPSPYEREQAAKRQARRETRRAVAELTKTTTTKRAKRRAG